MGGCRFACARQWSHPRAQHDDDETSSSVLVPHLHQHFLLVLQYKTPFGWRLRDGIYQPLNIVAPAATDVYDERAIALPGLV